ncbi:fimbrial protein [Salmonella enterica subsp. enterica serovar Caracas]|nr:fimbrial protein [Salmonella enterica subsp. enterica serovar Caracas]
MKQKKYKWFTGVLLWSLWGTTAAWSSEIAITISATINQPTCSVTDINGNNKTEVDFKDVLLENVGNTGVGITLFPLLMKVTCEGSVPIDKKMKMFINSTGGMMGYAGRNILGTTIQGLGIDLLDENSTPLTLNTWIPVMTGAGDIISINAGLVSENVENLQSGHFTSTASVIIAYQ